MRTKYLNAHRVRNALLFLFSDVFSPIILLILLILSFYYANSKTRYFSINVPLLYVLFLERFLKVFVTSLMIFLLARSALQKSLTKTLITASILILIHILKITKLKYLVIASVALMFYILKPNGIHLFMIPPVISFFLGVHNSPKSWIDEDVKSFVLLPYLTLLPRTNKRVWGELTLMIFTLFVSFLSRPIGIMSSLFFITARRINAMFPRTALISSVVLPFIGFSFGYIYFLEFQRGISIGEPYVFLSKLYIPTVLSVLYPSLLLFVFAIRALKKLIGRLKKLKPQAVEHQTKN